MAVQVLCKFFFSFLFGKNYQDKQLKFDEIDSGHYKIAPVNTKERELKGMIFVSSFAIICRVHCRI